MNLETDRLYIRNGTVEDFVKIYEYNFTKLEDIAGEFEYIKQDPKEIESWFDGDISKYYQELQQKNNYDLILYLKEGTIPVGNLLLDRINNEERSIEITCHIHPSHWGNGYMQEAILTILPFLYDIGFDAVIYSYGEGNIKSSKLCSKLGFELHSVKHNDYIRNGVQISTYRNILTKDRYNELYAKNKKL